MFERQWGGGAEIGVLYRVMTEADCERVGNCFMKGRLRVGDYALCLKHAGDCFYDYMLVERIANGWRGYPQATFGAYVFGDTFPDCHLSSREYHLLAAGEFIQRNHWLPFPENRVLTQDET
jgi:hypothetical protein